MDQHQNFTDIGEFGEFGLIDHLSEKIQLNNPSTVQGIGDDAAIVNYDRKYTVASTDMLLEGIHFDLMYTPLHHLGYKAIIANLSDIYAMNAQPEQVVVSFAVSQKFSVEMVDDIYMGMRIACDNYGIDLVGGDTSSSYSGLVISVTAFGKANKSDLVYRNGAEHFNLVCTTGDLGSAYLGLQVLEREKRVFMENPNAQPDLTGHDYVVGRQLKPEARKDIIDQLKGLKIRPTAMIDVSDGLASEMNHICYNSNVGCKIYEEKIPIHPDTYNLGVEFGLDPTVCALNGGEDYELVFTIKQKDFEKIKNEKDIQVIGHITEPNEGRKLVTRSNIEHNLEAQGWTPFKERKHE